MITLEQYEDIVFKKQMYESESCSCHINPPCSRCVEYFVSEEEIESMKKFEKANK